MFRYLLLVLIQITYISVGQNFTVTLSDRTVGLNETFEISFSLNDTGSDFSPPSFSDNFHIISGPNKSSSTRIINGSMSQESSYKYILRAKREGVFTILPASIKVKGRTIGTKPVTIQVKKGVESKKPNTPYNIASRKIHLEVKSNKSTCYVGEPVVLTYTLYFNLNIGNLSPKSMKYDGFWTENINISSETRQVTYKGEKYNSAIVKQMVLIPQSRGDFSISKMSLDLVASVPTNRRDFFGMMSSQNIDFTVESNSIVLKVKDLPAENKPDDFSGAVGDFNLSVNLDKDSIRVNESASFEIKVTGSGNLNLLSLPSLHLSSDLEVYDPKNSDKIIINDKGVKGYKEESYLIVPRYKGSYGLGVVEFSFFNPKTKKYVTLKSDKKTLHVSSSRFANDQNVTETNFGKEQINIINRDIKFIKSQYLGRDFYSIFYKSNLFFILLFIPIILFLIFILVKYNDIDMRLFFTRSILFHVTKKLEKMELIINDYDDQAFVASLSNIMFMHLSKRFDVNRSDFTIGAIENLLVNKKIHKEDVQEYLDLLSTLESYNYSAHKKIQISDRKSFINRISIIVNKIEKTYDL